MAHPPATQTSPPVPSAIKYYVGTEVPGLAQRFKNFDEKRVFGEYEDYVKSTVAGNFVIDFGKDDAWVTSSLKRHECIGLLENKRPAPLSTRWINIWAPNTQKELVETLAAHYEFSPRLLALMCSDPLTPLPINTVQSRSRLRNSWRASSRKSHDTHASEDAEGDIALANQDHDQRKDQVLNMNHYQIVDDVWHYSSVDWGQKYLCLGYNSLHSVPRIEATNPEDVLDQKDLPDGKRLWTWLILGDEGTVMSIHEDPYPGQRGILNVHQQDALRTIRRNQLNVFRQISHANDTSFDHSPLSILPIRRRLQDLNKANLKSADPAQSIDAPSLLFYYLFDDWYTTYGLVTRKQYGAELGQLRRWMLEKAELEHINRLHHIGRQLAVLKRIYQSYGLIIDRVLERKMAVTPRVGPNTAHDTHILDPAVNTTSADNNLRASLSTAAIVRFERLKDRINLYATSEIQECIDQKEALVMMNFNLMAIKQSNYVERLTRITILLAKVTILFLPVSLMTAYFSVQLDEDNIYSYKTYWTCFGVIMGLSILLLVVFGMVSGTVEGTAIYKSLSRSFLDACARALGRRKRKAK
ncbi:MAG: hypothetical protein M1827_006579 [Pycnora praestabilis]|nr:MAG: hypothetical protein M1827_006579 [Pycnora praestabilis]